MAIQITQLNWHIERLPPAMDGLKIVQLSDLHFRRPDRRLSRIKHHLEAYRPDLLFLTGDTLERWSNPERGLEALIHLLDLAHPPALGTFAVAGNHDPDNLEALCRKLPLTLLRNRSTIIQRGEGRINLAGLDHHWSDTEDVVGTLLAAESGLFTILLSHKPEVIHWAASAGVDVVLAGHTHGGQVRLPGLGAIATHSRMERKYADGEHLVGRTRLYVSRGLGTSLFPIRLFCRPEIPCIRLTSNRIRNEQILDP